MLRGAPLSIHRDTVLISAPHKGHNMSWCVSPRFVPRCSSCSCPPVRLRRGRTTSFPITLRRLLPEIGPTHVGPSEPGVSLVVRPVESGKSRYRGDGLVVIDIPAHSLTPYSVRRDQTELRSMRHWVSRGAPVFAPSTPMPSQRRGTVHVA